MRVTSIAFCALVLAVPRDALAQQVGNTLFVDQDGYDNRIVSDQTRAIGSQFGTEDNRVTQGGFSNRLSLTDNGTGNAITRLEQTDMLVDTLSTEPLRTNNATIVIGDATLPLSTVTGATVQLIQGASPDGLNDGANIANILLQQGAFAGISQFGEGNTANLTVNGLDAEGRILQQGNLNDAGLTVTGAGTSVTLEQFGDNLSLTDVIAADGSVTGVGGINVLSNGATVTITQTQGAL